MQYKGKESLIQLAAILAGRGITTAVVSPGSRNAPLIAALNRQAGIKCLSVVDERSAAFFALGIAQQTRKPVALACTSGTAALNYAPAIAEAYYQQVPLVVLTADRPPEWIDQGDGQTIRQQDVYANYIVKSVQLPAEPLNDNTRHYHARLIHEAVDAATWPVEGPVHINVPLSEPLYAGTTGNIPETVMMKLAATENRLETSQLDELAKTWNKAASKLIITGLLPPDSELNVLLNRLAEDNGVAVFTETTSNLRSTKFFPHIDRLIDGLSTEPAFVPDILLTMGGNIISRKVKAWLQQNKPAHHWHVAPGAYHTDSFRSLNLSIPLKPKVFLGDFLPLLHPGNGNYYECWNERQQSISQKHEAFLRLCAWSDLKAFEIILQNIPAGTILQAGNSTPVRYFQLFDLPEKSLCFGNRGVSGIDGCTSTAAGAAWANPALSLLITGDVSFFYDSNALWNINLPHNLRIIVVNNGGGNIFRIIPGPETLPELEEYIETPYTPPISKFADLYSLPYYFAGDAESLRTQLPSFMNISAEKPAIFEIKTPNKTSASVLRDYFQFLNK
jgi:2-succinyl-5-enolpyruvyl-6-hydroxy-3-cyclohexene-1-carboxylate synthase